jgi:hypothetical protein
MKTNFTFYQTKGIQNVYFPYLPTHLPNINISEYATANQWFFCPDVTGNIHIINGNSGGYIVMGMGKKKKWHNMLTLFFDLGLVGR